MTPTTEISVSKLTSVGVLEDELGVLMRRIRVVLAERAQMVHPELSSPAYSMLMALAHRGPLRAAALVEAFLIDKGAVSRHVQQLESLGLVARAPDPDDRRAALLRITDEGRERVDAVSVSRRHELVQRFADWSEEDLAEFAANLNRYNQTLEH